MVIRCPNLGAAETACAWSGNPHWIGLHIYSDGAVMFMRKGSSEWYPVARPTEDNLDELLRLRAFPELDYGDPSLLDWLRGRRTRKSLPELRAQLADLIEDRRMNLKVLELARVRAWKRSRL